MEDEVAALESVLAFIEAYDVAAIDALDGDEQAGDVALPVGRKASMSAKEKPVKRRKRATDSDLSREDGGQRNGGTTSYTTMLQRRKRAEVQTLREQVQELEAHLTRLQGARWGAQSASKKAQSTAASTASHRHLMPSAPSRICISDLWESAVAGGEDTDAQINVPRPFGSAMLVTGDSKWLDSAVTQYRLRHRSELKNRQLKQLMSQQMHLNTSILRLMQKRPLFSGLKKLLEASPPCSHPSESVEFHIVDAAIESEITQLHREVDLVFDRLPVDGSTSISCSLETKHDPRVGKYAEVRTTTPMQRSASNVAMQVWRKTCSNPNQHLNFFSETSGPDSYVKNFFLPIARRSEREGGDVLLNVRHHARKFDEANRFVMVMYAIVQLPVPGVYLREDSWTLVTPSATDPRHESVVQSYYRIHTKLSESDAHPTDEATEMCSFVMNALGRLTRRNMQTTQNWLLDEASSPFPDWILT